MGKERLFYLDFVRALAAILIIMTHYNAVFLLADPQINSCYIWKEFPFNVYIGDLGVSLFLIISSAALTYVYSDKDFQIGKFYYKRWKTIYPMYWIAYICSFLIIYVYMGAWSATKVPRSHLLISVLGFDGYLADVIPTYYLVGEWFVGFIVIFYIIYPVLRWLLNKYPRALAIGALAIYFVMLTFIPAEFRVARNIFIRLPELLFGMYFIKYIKKVNLPLAIGSIIVLGVNGVLKPKFSSNIQVTYVGIAAFLILVYIAQFIHSKKCKYLFEWISKYSYAIFLIHHILIYNIMLTFNLYTITHIESYLIFLGFCVVIAILSQILFDVDHYVNKGVSKLLSRKQKQ